MASLKIGAVPHSDERYITKLKFFKLRYMDFFFQWKLWYCFFQIWNPGGLQEAFRSCILVWSFDFLSKSAEKTMNIAHLKIGGYSHFDGRYVTKPKIFSKQDREIIFFSSESWDVPFSKSETQEAFRRPPSAVFWYEKMTSFWKFQENPNFQTKIGQPEASWRPPGFRIWKKQHLSFHWKKKIILLSFLKQILA